jgi:hypothetical protein
MNTTIKHRHDLRHCDDPGCCVGVLIGKCRRCGQIVGNDSECGGPRSTEKKAQKRDERALKRQYKRFAGRHTRWIEEAIAQRTGWRRLAVPIIVVPGDSIGPVMSESEQ